ncbi:Rad and Gem related GTP binding protein 1 [Mytilus galloprovincialis]|uniref:Rad and Gem related GTP binding protein 1 n=1 Tax=Mytilus galloprovincialis TaxID=29158 RepID=A0A8B6GWJ9_MYTGA|nr:Rad and Gem related GTP binding protein 1 [Mytilus galloprovincialis]
MTKRIYYEVQDNNHAHFINTTRCVLSELLSSVIKEDRQSEPNSRSSFIKKKKQHTYDCIENDLRNNSFGLPMDKFTRYSNEWHVNDSKKQFKRRSFKTSEGLLNSFPFRRRQSSCLSVSSKYRPRLTSDASNASSISSSWSHSSSCSTGYYRVPVMGAHGVGTTALKNRFMSSENMLANKSGINEIDERKLTVVVDNEESTIEFIDFLSTNDDDLPADAYVVVFSVHDSDSFSIAEGFLQYLRNELYSDRPIILVANKIDLVRKRQVSKEEARQLAKEFECKYIETSAVLNHKVDELLVGLLKQIKLKLNPEAIQKAAVLTQVKGKRHNLCKVVKRLLNKILRRTSKPLSQCENLFNL